MRVSLYLGDIVSLRKKVFRNGTLLDTDIKIYVL